MLLVSDVFVFGISRIHDKSSMTFADVYGLDDDNDAPMSSILHIQDILICPASSHRLGGEMSRTAKPQSSANCLLYTRRSFRPQRGCLETPMQAATSGLSSNNSEAVTETLSCCYTHITR